MLTTETSAFMFKINKIRLVVTEQCRGVKGDTLMVAVIQLFLYTSLGFSTKSERPKTSTSCSIQQAAQAWTLQIQGFKHSISTHGE